MWVKVDMDIVEVLEDITCEESIDNLRWVFGEERLGRYVERTYSGEEIEDIISSLSQNKRAIAWMVRDRGKPLTFDEMGMLNITETDCISNGIKYEEVDEVDENGRRIRYVTIEESSDQMKLFPEMEEGLPPYRYKVARDCASKN